MLLELSQARTNVAACRKLSARAVRTRASSRACACRAAPIDRLLTVRAGAAARAAGGACADGGVQLGRRCVFRGGVTLEEGRDSLDSVGRIADVHLDGGSSAGAEAEQLEELHGVVNCLCTRSRRGLGRPEGTDVEPEI